MQKIRAKNNARCAIDARHDSEDRKLDFIRLATHGHAAAALSTDARSAGRPRGVLTQVETKELGFRIHAEPHNMIDHAQLSSLAERPCTPSNIE
jgi:hypothetical protein